MNSNASTYMEYVLEITTTVDQLWTRQKEDTPYKHDDVDYYVTNKVINLAIRDLGNSKSYRQILERFIDFKLRDKTYPEKLKYLEDLIEVREFEDLQINTFPFGDLGKMIYPEFVGVCQGDTTFNEIMTAINIQCKKMINRFNNEIDKTVLVLTDKWDSPTFRKKYAASFVNYAYNHNIVFIILLVTDLGIRRIPFTISERIDLFRGRDWRIESSSIEKSDKNALTKLKKLDDCIYEYRSSVLISGRGSYRCIIDFKRMEYTCESLVSPGLKKQGKIPKSAFNKFAQRVIGISELPGPGYVEDYSKALDYTLNIVEIFGKHFEWTEHSEMENNPSICVQLKTAIRKLLSASGFEGMLK